MRLGIVLLTVLLLCGCSSSKVSMELPKVRIQQEAPEPAPMFLDPGGLDYPI